MQIVIFVLTVEVEGDIACSGKVVIGPQGTLKGNLNCQNAEIMGHVNGKIVVSELLSLKETAKIVGEIKTKTLMIEPKAIFSGTCDIRSNGIHSTTENLRLTNIIK